MKNKPMTVHDLIIALSKVPANATVILNQQDDPRGGLALMDISFIPGSNDLWLLTRTVEEENAKLSDPFQGPDVMGNLRRLGEHKMAHGY